MKLSDEIKELREKLANLEHKQWEHWSKSLAKELESLKVMVSNKEIDNALHLIEDRLERWKINWKPYSNLPEETKEFDRIWADKVLKEVKDNVK